MIFLRYFITSKAKRSVLKLFLSHPGSAFYTREVARLTGEPLNAVRRELGYLEKAGLLRSYMQGNLKYYEVIESFPVLAEWQRIVLFKPGMVNDHAHAVEKENTSESRAPRAVKKAAHQGDSIQKLTGEEAQENTPSDSERITAAKSEEPPVETGGVPGDERQGVTTSVIAEKLHDYFITKNSVTMAIIYGKAAFHEEIPEDGIDLLVIGDIPTENLIEIVTRIEDETGVPIKLVRMTRSDFDYRNAKGDPLIRRIWSEKKLVIKGRY